MEKQNVLIIHPGQFGYHTGTYFYCSKLKEIYNVTYVGFMEGYPSKEIVGITYVHLKQRGKSFANRLALFKMVSHQAQKTNYSFVLVNYFPMCSTIRLLIPYSVAVEIRSSYIFTSRLRRTLYNIFMILEVRLFKNITTISQGIVRYLLLPQRTVVVPLGGEKQPDFNKSIDQLNMLYVGTFVNRDIENTIRAFATFYKQYSSRIQMSYTIVGFGPPADVENILSTIREVKMSKYIQYVGTIRFPELNWYYENCNIGISYIPMTKYYDIQPPTKTFEYLLSGMVVLGTNTSEHRQLINTSNGVLVGDSVDEQYNGMVKLFKRRFQYSLGHIQKSARAYSWEYIVENDLLPYIRTIR